MSRQYRDLSNVRVTYIETIDEAMELMRWLGERHANDTVAFDTETGGLRFYRDPLRLVQFGDTETAWAVPWHRWSGLVVDVFKRWEGQWVAHNLSFDTHFLEYHSGGDIRVPFDRAHDTMVQSHLLDPVSSHALKTLATRLVNPQAAAGQAALDRAVKEQGWGWDTIPVTFQMYWAYGALDTILTAHLHDLMKPQIDARCRELYDLEIAVLDVKTKMERRGMRIDRDHVIRSIGKIEVFLEQMRAFIQSEYGVKNPGSAPQLSEFFLDQGIELTKLTANKTNYQMDKEVLSGIQHPLAQHVLRYRQAQKVNSTYLSSLLELADDHDCVHCSIRTLGARTGRMSISDPALQTLPRSARENPFSLAVRDSFIASPDHLLASVDYDQIEYKLLGSLAEGDLPTEEQLVRMAVESGDVHTTTARQVFQDPTITAKDEVRQRTKNGVFARLYGAGPAKFALTVGITEAEAHAFYEMYDRAFPSVSRFTSTVESVVRQRGLEGDAYVRTRRGRYQPVDLREAYKAVNYLIQAEAADVLKAALVRLDDAGFGDHMLLPIHDEVIVDLPKTEAEELTREIESVMADHSYLIPITASGELLERLGDKYRKAL